MTAPAFHFASPMKKDQLMLVFFHNPVRFLA